MTGEQTESLVGSYATMALAISAWDSATVTAITDHIELHIDPAPPAKGFARFHLIKVETAA